MKKISNIIIIIISLIVPAVTSECTQPVIIAIRPLGHVDPSLVQTVRSGIISLYKASVQVLPPLPLPGDAYYTPHRRYRAEKLLDYLEKTTDSRYTKVTGLTSVDISTTKGSIPDWGIFGLGSLGGKCCVVSSFRLRHGNASDALFRVRIAKVVNHEIGHTFGLDHCPHRGCTMEDAKGTIVTVDNEKGLCPSCKNRLSGIIKEQ